jgi:hypothetical protein
MARRPRRFSATNLSVNLTPSAKLAAMTDKLRFCVLNTNICLGWTNCKLLTRYCLGWVSWCRLFTNCGGRTYIDCHPGTLPPGCDLGSRIDPGDILTDPEIYFRQVAELKADLQEAIRQLDAHEQEIAGISKQTGGG